MAQLVSQVRRRPAMLKELRHQQLARQLKEAVVAKVVARLNDETAFVDSAAQVVKAVAEEAAVQVTAPVARAMIKGMGMRFKKVRHIPMAGNSERSLVLRQQWALAFF